MRQRTHTSPMNDTLKNLSVNMKTLYESILDNTKDKVADVKDVIRDLPPTNKDWRRPDKHNWQINFRCPNIIKEYIDSLPDDILKITSLNPWKLKKEDLTTIRCVVNSYLRNTHVELIGDDTTDTTPGVNLIGLDDFLNGVSVTNAKKNIVEALSRIHNDHEMFGRMMKHVVDSLYTLNKYQYCNEKYIWEF